MSRERARSRRDAPRLTARGAGLLLAGVGLAILAPAFASDLVARVAAFVLALPALAMAYAVGARWRVLRPGRARRLVVHRQVAPSHVAVGGSAIVAVSTDHDALPPWSVLRERAATPLGARVEAGAPDSPAGRRAPSDRTTPTRYSIHPRRRGTWRLGPAVVRRSDPLGLATWRQQAGGDVEVLVWPRTEEVAAVASRLAGEHRLRSGSGPARPTLEDLSVREYRAGDDVRRVHWRSTARYGELMVRSDEPVNPRTAAVLLDLGAVDGETDDVREWAVSAAASVGRALLAASFAVGALVPPYDLLRSTAAVRTRSLESLMAVFAEADGAAGDGPGNLALVQVAGLTRDPPAVVAAVLVAPSPGLLDELAGMPTGRGRWALVVECPTTGARSADAAASTLRAAGWLAATARSTDGLADAWSRALDEGRSPGRDRRPSRPSPAPERADSRAATARR